MSKIPVKSYKRKGPKGKVVTVKGYTRGGKKGIVSDKDYGYTGTLHGAKMYVHRTEKGSEKSGVNSFDDYNPFLPEAGEFNNLPRYPKSLYGDHFKTKARPGEQFKNKKEARKAKHKKSRERDIWNRVEDKVASFVERHGEKYKKIL